MQGVVLLLAVSVFCTVGTCVAATEDMCEGKMVSGIDTTLSEQHSGCDSNYKSRSSDCVAAMNRFCEKRTYPTAIKTLGVSREHVNNIIGMSCVRSELKWQVKMNILQQKHDQCNTVSKSQSADCLAAIHRYCMEKLRDDKAAGISQEIPAHSHLTVACFISPKKQHVSFNVLGSLLSTCKSSNSASDNCFAAASRWCVNAGYDGGITQEVSHDGTTVACYNAEFAGDVYISRNGESEITHICSLTFDTKKGHVESYPKYLKYETYDNMASSVELNSDFQITKSVTETSSFTESSSVTFGAEVSVSVGFPVFGEGGITLSTSITNDVSMTKETMKTTEYTTSSPVNVPAGKAVVKEAMVMMAKLDVPYTAIGLTRLGVKTEIHGMWKGVSSYNFEIKQRDMKDRGCPCASKAPKKKRRGWLG